MGSPSTLKHPWLTWNLRLTLGIHLTWNTGEKHWLWDCDYHLLFVLFQSQKKVPSRSLTASGNPWRVTRPQKESNLPFPSFFRGETLNFGGVVVWSWKTKLQICYHSFIEDFRISKGGIQHNQPVLPFKNLTELQTCCLNNLSKKQWLVGGWTNPFEKYEPNSKHFPK